MASRILKPMLCAAVTSSLLLGPVLVGVANAQTASPNAVTQNAQPASETSPQPTASSAPVPAAATPAPQQPAEGQAAQPQTQTQSPAPAQMTDEGAALPQSAGERSDIPHNLSPIGMFMAADWVVKAVMSLLALASVATWTILIAKSMQLSTAKSRIGRGFMVLHDARSLSQAASVLEKKRGIVPLMVKSALYELKMSEPALDYAGNEGVKERVASALSRIEARASRNMSVGTGILATIGSIAPFVGLFGTVWGIMNSFIGISQAQTTNLAVVAPGIAEALLATAIGLVAAIPAVVIYNVFARAVTGYRQRLADCGSAVERLVSRDLDFRKMPAEMRAQRLKLVTE